MCRWIVSNGMPISPLLMICGGIWIPNGSKGRVPMSRLENDRFQDYEDGEWWDDEDDEDDDDGGCVDDDLDW